MILPTLLFILISASLVGIIVHARSHNKQLQGYQKTKTKLSLKPQYGDSTPPLQATQALENPPLLPKPKLRLLKTQDEYKHALNLCEEHHFSNIEQSLIVIGGIDGIQDRGYTGETCERSEKVLADIEEGYLAGGVIAKMIDEEYNDTFVQKEKISDLLVTFKDLNQQTEQSLHNIENAWEIIAKKLETADQSFKQNRLRIAALEELHNEDGILPIKAKNWTDHTMPMIDEVFELSKTDPVGVLSRQLVDLEKHLKTTAQIIDLVETERDFFKSWIGNHELTMEQRGFHIGWLRKRLTEIQIHFSSKDIKCLKALKANVMNLSQLVDTYLVQEQRINQTLPDEIEKAKSAISKACGMERDMAFGQGKFCTELEATHHILKNSKLAIATGDISSAENYSMKLDHALSDITTKLTDIQQAALKGRSQLDAHKQKFGDLSMELDAEARAVDYLLQHTQPLAFHRDIIDYMDKSERMKETVLDKITQVEKSLSNSQFFDAIDEFKQLELQLDQLEKTLLSLKQAQREVREIRSKNEQMIESIENRYKEACAKRKFAYISDQTIQLYQDVKLSITAALERWDEAKQAEESQTLMDPRETASTIQKANHAVDSLLSALKADQELYEFLQTKVQDINDIVQQATDNLENAAQANIVENSEVTDELISDLSTLLRGWKTLKEKIHTPQQEWTKLRFEYDVFFHGIDSINTKLADDLNLAKEASEKIKAASEELDKISAWRGESGLTVELTDCSKIIHIGLQALNQGDYKTVISQAKQARIEMRQKLHQARKTDTKFQIDDSWVRTHPLGKHSEERDKDEPKRLNYTLS